VSHDPGVASGASRPAPPGQHYQGRWRSWRRHPLAGQCCDQPEHHQPAGRLSRLSLHVPSMWASWDTVGIYGQAAMAGEAPYWAVQLGVVHDHDERSSPVQAVHQHKRLPGWPSGSPVRPLVGSPCNSASSSLVTAPQTRVGSETRSRHKAYGNRTGDGATYPVCNWVRNEVTP
jgi:hypothetical protein